MARQRTATANGTEPSNTGALDGVVMLTRTSALLARAMGQALGKWKMSWPQALSLLILADHQDPPLSATALVELLGLGRTAMTSVVDRLEAHGWLERRRLPNDRRTAQLVLTQSGLDTIDQIRPVLNEAARRLFTSATSEDLTAWRSSLSRLAQVLEKQVPAGAED